MTEEWRDINGYEGFYQVSDNGLVKRLSKIITHCDGKSFYWKGRILKFDKDTKGYYTVNLSKNGIVKRFWVHRLVAHAFIKSIGPNDIVNHLDGIKTNNNVDNLEITSSKGNTQHAIKLGLIKLRGEDGGTAKLTNKTAQEIRERYKQGNISMKQLGLLYQVSAQTVCNAIHHKTYFK